MRIIIVMERFCLGKESVRSKNVIGYMESSPAKRRCPGLMNFVSAIAYHFCLALPAAFTQPGVHLLSHPCREGGGEGLRGDGWLS